MPQPRTTRRRPGDSVRNRTPRPPRDRLAAELASIYQEAQDRLEHLVEAALERGATGTAAQGNAQRAAIRAVLADLRGRSPGLAAGTIARAYTIGATAADAAIGSPAIAFAGVHTRAVEVLAGNIAAKFDEAIDFVGRRVDDALRQAALRETAAGIAAGRARVEVSEALHTRIVREAIVDATTGFVDAGGARWSLESYTEMVARTTTREAVSAGTANRLLEVGQDLVTISEHLDACDICIPYEGQTYSLDGSTPGVDVLDEWPPFHPNCRHVMTPAAANLDAYERDLGL